MWKEKTRKIQARKMETEAEEKRERKVNWENEHRMEERRKKNGRGG